MMRKAVQENLAPFVMTPRVQRLLELRALVWSKKASLIWKLVDMRGNGWNETDECRRLAWNCIMGGGKSKAEDLERLLKLRASGQSVSPRWKALKAVQEHWQARWRKVQGMLEAEGAA